MPAMTTHAVAALHAVEGLAARNLSTQRLIEEIVHRIVGVVEVDAFVAASTDPDTSLCLGAGLVYEMSNDLCKPFWEHEFLIPDYNKFVDLTPEHAVGDLREATGGKLARSPRYRTLNRISDLEDELRMVCHAGGRSWGNVQLNRRTGRQPFADSDRSFMRALAPLAGSALRRALLDEPARSDPLHAPGVVLLAEDGTILNVTAEAESWLRELAFWRDDGAELHIHPELIALSIATLADDQAASRRVRLRSRHGTWVVAHASALRDAGQVALVIEPAKASEIAPIIVEAYGLTHREVQVTRLVARGSSTSEIAATLFLSRHTVRDHLKAIFEKVGVRSRGELTAKVFSENYQPHFDDAILDAWERTDARMSGVVIDA